MNISARFVMMNATEYCKQYSHEFLDVESCMETHKYATQLFVSFSIILIGVATFTKAYCQHSENRQVREEWHDLQILEKSPPTLSERFFEALKTRIPEHTHELSDRNPFKGMARLFNGVQSAQAAWRRIRG